MIGTITFAPPVLRPCNECRERAIKVLNAVSLIGDIAGILLVINDLGMGKATRREALLVALILIGCLVATGILIGRRQGIHLLADRLTAARRAEHAHEDEGEDEETPEAAPVHTNAVEPTTEDKGEAVNE